MGKIVSASGTGEQAEAYHSDKQRSPGWKCGRLLAYLREVRRLYWQPNIQLSRVMRMVEEY